MKTLLVFIACLVITANGCKIRRISDGKPPKNGIFTGTDKGVTGEKMFVEKEYRDGEMIRETIRFQNQQLASERFLKAGGRTTDSLRLYYRSGQLQSMMVANDSDRIFVRGYFENGMLQFAGDTAASVEYYESGHVKYRTELQKRQIYRVLQWYENGTAKELSEWQNDKRNGRWIKWDSTGAMIHNELYDNGKQIR